MSVRLNVIREWNLAQGHASLINESGEVGIGPGVGGDVARERGDRNVEKGRNVGSKRKLSTVDDMNDFQPCKRVLREGEVVVESVERREGT